MSLPTTGTVDVGMKDGAQLRWRIKNPVYDPDGRYGPCIDMDLNALNEEYLGATAKVWPRLQQKRLDLVRKLRKDEVPDEAIEATLIKKGFKFDRIDEPDETLVGFKGGAYKVLLAVCGGDRKYAQAVLDRCESFDDLAAAMDGGSFVITTKVNDDGYPRIDLREDVFPDMEAKTTEEDSEDWEPGDDLPDDDPAADANNPLMKK
jgi:hypothetical protein